MCATNIAADHLSVYRIECILKIVPDNYGLHLIGGMTVGGRGAINSYTSIFSLDNDSKKLDDIEPEKIYTHIKGDLISQIATRFNHPST